MTKSLSQDIKMRDEFTPKTKETLAKRVGFHCSNPDCRTLTCGPSSENNKHISIGVAAHITAASENGPRYDYTLSSKERSSIENGIWLCQNCSKLVDNDPNDYSVNLLNNWKADAEHFAKNSLSKKTTEIIHHPELLNQLSTFARIDFQYSYAYDQESDKDYKTYVIDATKVVYRMIACAYLQTAQFLKRDRFIFGFNINAEVKDNKVLFFGEVVTHLTPFGYFFGKLTTMLNNGKIKEVYAYMDSFPTIAIAKDIVLGNLNPFKISRVNPTRIRIELNNERYIFKKGLLTTSDLLTFLLYSTNGGFVGIDDINDEDCINKISKLLCKIEDGFDFTEITIDVDDPENWFVNNY